jgi:hypothetical protein
MTKFPLRAASNQAFSDIGVCALDSIARESAFRETTTAAKTLGRSRAPAHPNARRARRARACRCDPARSRPHECVDSKTLRE